MINPGLRNHRFPSQQGVRRRDCPPPPQPPVLPGMHSAPWARSLVLPLLPQWSLLPCLSWDSGRSQLKGRVSWGSHTHAPLGDPHAQLWGARLRGRLLIAICASPRWQHAACAGWGSPLMLGSQAQGVLHPTAAAGLHHLCVLSTSAVPGTPLHPVPMEPGSPTRTHDSALPKASPSCLH